MENSVIFFLLLCFSYSSANICLQQPPQNGGFPSLALSKRVPECVSKERLCAVSTEHSKYRGGEDLDVVVVMTDQYFSLDNPGTIELTYCHLGSGCDKEEMYMPLGSCHVRDRVTVTPASITFSVILPNLDGVLLLRASYITNSADDEVFYSCSTLDIEKTGSHKAPTCKNDPEFSNPMEPLEEVIDKRQIFGATSATVPPATPAPAASPGVLFGYSALVVGVAAGIIGFILIVIIAVIIVIAVKCRSSGGGSRRRDSGPGKPIPVVPLSQIQQTKMNTLLDSDT